MDIRECKNCIFSGLSNQAFVCEYPLPAYLIIRLSGSNFISGYEAQMCCLYKTKVDLINDTKEQTK